MDTNDYTLSLSSLAIECTRRCNMKCAHCMRGTAQAKNLNPEAVYRLFERLTSVWSIIPTGGEPSLNPKALDTIASAITKNAVHVAGVYIVTNGKKISDRFIKSLMNLILATDVDEDTTGIALSRDMFHDQISYKNLCKLKLFAGFDSESKHTDWTTIRPLAMGRAKMLTDIETQSRPHSNPFYDAEIDEETKSISLPDCQLSLTVDGDLLSDCDYAYEDTDQLKLCNVFEDNWMDTLTEKIRKAIATQSE